MLKKILPPSNRSVTSVSKETGVAVVTINSWLAKLKEGRMSLDEDDENPSSMRNYREKLDLLIEYPTVSEEDQETLYAKIDAPTSGDIYLGIEGESSIWL